MPDDKEKLEKLHTQVQKLQSLLEHLTKEGMVYFINIEKLEFQGPILDGLEFIFDKINVKEVSGSLNLGNNLGVGAEGKKEGIKPSSIKPMEKKPSEEKKPSDGKKQEQAKPKASSADQIDMQKYAELEKKLEKKLEEVFPKSSKSKKPKSSEPSLAEKSMDKVKSEIKKEEGLNNEKCSDPPDDVIDRANQIVSNPDSVLKLKEDPFLFEMDDNQFNVSSVDFTEEVDLAQHIFIKPGTVLKLKE